MKSSLSLLCGAHCLFFVASLAHEGKPLSECIKFKMVHLQCLWKRRCANQVCDRVFPQLGTSNAGEVTRDGISLSPLLLQASLLPLSCQAGQAQPRSGSPMPCSGSQLNEMVMAKRVPHWTFSTRCRFSEPEVKNDTRPAKREGGTCEWIGTQLQLSLHCSLQLSLHSSLLSSPGDQRAHRWSLLPACTALQQLFTV